MALIDIITNKKLGRALTTGELKGFGQRRQGRRRRILGWRRC